MRHLNIQSLVLVLSTLLLASLAHSDEIYTIDIEASAGSGQHDLVRIDTVTGTILGRTPIDFGAFEALNGANFSSAPDLTFANGNIFALTGSGYLSEITRLGNVVNFGRVTDTNGNLLPNAIEGLAYDSSNLVIGYNWGGDVKRVKYD